MGWMEEGKDSEVVTVQANFFGFIKQVLGQWDEPLWVATAQPNKPSYSYQIHIWIDCFKTCLSVKKKLATSKDWELKVDFGK